MKRFRIAFLAVLGVTFTIPVHGAALAVPQRINSAYNVHNLIEDIVLSTINEDSNAESYGRHPHHLHNLPRSRDGYSHLEAYTVSPSYDDYILPPNYDDYDDDYRVPPSYDDDDDYRNPPSYDDYSDLGAYGYTNQKAYRVPRGYADHSHI